MATKARTRLPPEPYKSELEAAFSRRLKLRRRAGESVRWGYEELKFKIDGGWYTPDFWEQLPDGAITIYEVKGWSRNLRAGRKDWLAARSRYPEFHWVYVTAKKRKQGEPIFEYEGP